MADSFNKKEREKKKRKRKKEKAEKKLRQKLEGKKSEEFMYVDADGNLTSVKPDPAKKQEFDIEDIQISTPKDSDADELEQERKGTVKFFNVDKGFGFIIDSETQESYFAHINNLIDEIKEADKVLFEIGTGPKGPIAMNVKLA
ncbi:MAG: cold shock domain-containing protein [Bacteroidota bacterium]